MPHISTLVHDIQKLVTSNDGWFTEELSSAFAKDVGVRMQEHFHYDRGKTHLRMSKLGPQCPCALWHYIHKPELAEKLPPWAEIKYAFGHILEALAIVLAKAAGHEVTGEQDALELDGVTGHRDCVIDGCVVDVKSASSIGFQKFKNGDIAKSDSFGYLDQLDAYVVGSHSDPLVRTKDVGYILAIDKTLGHMCLYEHKIREDNIRRRVDEYKRIVASETTPRCTCASIPDGKSGNQRLDVKASYNAFKYCCKPSLRTFLYANGPVYLTHVERKPDVPEINKQGNFVNDR